MQINRKIWYNIARLNEGIGNAEHTARRPIRQSNGGKENMKNESKTILRELIPHYYVVNQDKIEAQNESKEIGDEIKEIMTSENIQDYIVNGLRANARLRTSEHLDEGAVLVWAAKQGLRIPKECYKKSTSIVLTVKPTASAKKSA